MNRKTKEDSPLVLSLSGSALRQMHWDGKRHSSSSGKKIFLLLFFFFSLQHSQQQLLLDTQQYEFSVVLKSCKLEKCLDSGAVKSCTKKKKPKTKTMEKRKKINNWLCVPSLGSRPEKTRAIKSEQILKLQGVAEIEAIPSFNSN